MSYTAISDLKAQHLYRNLRARITRGQVPLNHRISLDAAQPDAPIWTLRDFCVYMEILPSYERLEAQLARRTLAALPMGHPAIGPLRAALAKRDREINISKSARYRRKLQRLEYERQLAVANSDACSDTSITAPAQPACSNQPDC